MTEPQRYRVIASFTQYGVAHVEASSFEEATAKAEELWARDFDKMPLDDQPPTIDNIEEVD